MDTMTIKTLSKVKDIEHKRIRTKKILSNTSTVVWKIFRAVFLFGLCFILLYPLTYMLSVSFRDMKDVYDPAVIWIPKNFTLANIKDVTQVMNYFQALRTSLQVNIVSSLLQLAICAITGYGFARFSFKGKKLLFSVMIFTIVVPPQVIITPIYLGFKSINLLNSPSTFYLMAALGCGIKSGLFIYLFKQFFSGLPRELEDAAAIDGCGFVSCFIRIMVPNAVPVFITGAVLSIVWYWNDYYMGSMLMNNHETVTMALVKLPSSLRLVSGYDIVDPYKIITRMQAGSLLTIAPILVFYIVIQRFFVQGIERSGIVG